MLPKILPIALLVKIRQWRRATRPQPNPMRCGTPMMDILLRHERKETGKTSQQAS